MPPAPPAPDPNIPVNPNDSDSDSDPDAPVLIIVPPGLANLPPGYLPNQANPGGNNPDDNLN